MARNAVSCGHDDDTGKAFDLLASVVRFPDRHDRNRGWFRCRPIRVVGRLEWFCGGHGPGETPGPFPNPEAKAWHGDGTAPDRVWESSTPPHHTYRKPLGAHAPRGFRIPETLTTQTHTPPTKTPGASRMPGHKQDTSGTHTATGPPHTRGTTTDLCCDVWIGPAVLNVLMPFGRWSCQGKRYGNRIATRRLIGARLASR